MSSRAHAVRALMLAAGFVITSCSSAGSPASSPTTPSQTASQPSAPGTFTSATYGYSVRLPVSWISAQATSKWDGHAGLTIESPQVDKFESGSTAVLWATAAPWSQDLAAWTTYAIHWTNQFHGDSCTAAPASTTPITIGGQPGVLLAYDCGVLINNAVTVHSGVGYWFVFRDPGVYAATDPTDHATFLTMLRSVQFPD